MPPPAGERGRAFGLPLEAGFPVPGLTGPPRHGDAARCVRLALVRRSELSGAAAPDAPVLSRVRRPDGRTAVRFVGDDVDGYLLESRGYGRFHIDGDAHLVRCAPVQRPAARWQRFLSGQVLPFVAVLHGFEVFHASMVELEGRGVVLVAASGGGKSTLAACLLARGARLVTDDVVAVDSAATGAVAAEPGLALASIRHDAVARLGADVVTGLGTPVNRDDEAVRIAVDVVDRPVPVSSVFFVFRRPTDRRPPLIESLPTVDPTLLLGASYNFVIRTPDRLTRQLDVCARLARTASFHRVWLDDGTGPVEAADAIAARAAADPAIR